MELWVRKTEHVCEIGTIIEGTVTSCDCRVITVFVGIYNCCNARNFSTDIECIFESRFPILALMYST